MIGHKHETNACDDLTHNNDRKFMLACYLINSELHDLEELKKTFIEAMDLSRQINIKQKPILLQPYLDVIVNEKKSDESFLLTSS